MLCVFFFIIFSRMSIFYETHSALKPVHTLFILSIKFLKNEWVCSVVCALHLHWENLV